MILMTLALMLQGFNGPGFNKVRSSLNFQSCLILVCYSCFTAVFTLRACRFAIFMVYFDAGFTDFGKSYLLEKVTYFSHLECDFRCFGMARYDQS